MFKKSLLSILLIIILIIGVEIFNRNKSKIENNTNTNIVKNEIEISSTYVTDDCIDEWEDYATTVQEEIKETSEPINDENRKYIIREKDNIINIYYINEDEEEILYKVTDISTEYLAKEDVEKLKVGIEIKGTQNLQQMLEDFE